jgi:hypothetical protein
MQQYGLRQNVLQDVTTELPRVWAMHRLEGATLQQNTGRVSCSRGVQSSGMST